jgi:transcriptional regulator with XRE-family HTH domain
MFRRALAALKRQLAAIPDGKVSDVARRAQISPRQLRRLRAGQIGRVQLDTILRLADALDVSAAELLGGASPHAKRPAPTGRRRGKPRTMRRQGDVGEAPVFDEDEDLLEEI